MGRRDSRKKAYPKYLELVIWVNTDGCSTLCYDTDKCIEYNSNA